MTRSGGHVAGCAAYALFGTINSVQGPRSPPATERDVGGLIPARWCHPPDATGRQVFRPLDQLDQLNPLDQLDQLVKNPSSNQPAPPPITPPREHTFMATTPRQRRTLAVAIGVAVLLGILGGGGIWLTRPEPEPQPGALRLYTIPTRHRAFFTKPRTNWGISSRTIDPFRGT